MPLMVVWLAAETEIEWAEVYTLGGESRRDDLRLLLRPSVLMDGSIRS